jgi:hypothetical protein
MTFWGLYGGSAETGLAGNGAEEGAGEGGEGGRGGVGENGIDNQLNEGEETAAVALKLGKLRDVLLGFDDTVAIHR